MQRSQRPTYKRSYPNLDSLFGHVFNNLLGEPLTPTKISIFYLIRILFETHFGHLHKPSIWEPFTAQEKNRLFQFLYGLMSLPAELSYNELRVVTREAFEDEREICLKFYAAMEQIACGEADINLAIEDEFYTNKYAKDPSLPKDHPRHEAIELATRDDLHFSSTFSFIYRWLKKILAQWNKEDTTTIYQLTCAFRHWILDGRHVAHPSCLPYPVLPHFLNCSSRAREHIASFMTIVQKNPFSTFSYKEISLVVEEVKKYHKDVYEAHLLEGMIAVQRKDPLTATEAFKKFFDLSMFELTEDIAHFARTHRLGVPNNAPMMYGPIIQARVCRLFGDIPMARQLLYEAIQQSQIRYDVIAHQLANTELHALDFIGGGALLEDKATKARDVDQDRRIVRKPLTDIDDLHGHTRSGGPCCKDSEQDYEVVHEMDSIGKMLMILKDISEGHFRLNYGRIAETGLVCPLQSDMDERGRRVTAYGFAIISSNMVRNGYYAQAISSGKELLRCNVVHQEGGQLHSESIAVAMANMAYGHAAHGDYDKAMNVIAELTKAFPDDVLWQCHRHGVIAGAVINFEKDFLLRKFKPCKEVLNYLNSHSAFEANIRRALVCAASGMHHDSYEILQKLMSGCVDVYATIRIHMQRGCFHSAQGDMDKAKTQFDEAMMLAMGTTIKNIRSMITRRIATMKMLRGNYVKAAEQLKKCEEEIDANGSHIEKACLYMTKAKIARYTKKDPRPALKHCRVLSNKRWPGMEKMVFAELASFHGPNGQQPNASLMSKVCEQFARLEEDFPGPCDWLLL